MDKDFGFAVFVLSTLIGGMLIGYQIKGCLDAFRRSSQYELSLADDQKRVDKHIYDLGYYDGYQDAGFICRGQKSIMEMKRLAKEKN